MTTEVRRRLPYETPRTHYNELVPPKFPGLTLEAERGNTPVDHLPIPEQPQVTLGHSCKQYRCACIHRSGSEAIMKYSIEYKDNIDISTADEGSIIDGM